MRANDFIVNAIMVAAGAAVATLAGYAVNAVKDAAEELFDKISERRDSE